ncbi:hypothetical protein CR513_12120, partial [Mucuna pruriens]
MFEIDDTVTTRLHNFFKKMVKERCYEKWGTSESNSNIESDVFCGRIHLLSTYWRSTNDSYDIII